MSISKITSTEDAVSVTASGDVIASSGWGGHGVAEEVLIELEKRFLDTGEPQGLTLAQRHTTNALMRLKLGRELAKRSLDPKLDLVDES